MRLFEGKNLAVLASLTASSSSRVANAAVKKTNMNNLLMQLRKFVVAIH